MKMSVLAFATLALVSCSLKSTAADPAEAVDLGLSVKWANVNLGAKSPVERGDYYSWGETSVKTEWSAANSETMGLSFQDMRNKGTLNADSTLTLNADAAHKALGGDWRMPTLDEVKELEENCTWEWTAIEGVNGFKVTGATGNSIFLPCGSYNKRDKNRNSLGVYWTSTAIEDGNDGAYCLYFNEYSLEDGCGYGIGDGLSRGVAMPIRAVRE